MKRLSQKGFTMIELLVVLLIIGILAAVAAPLFLSNTERARASEAVSTVGMIREAMRNWKSQYGSWHADVTDGKTYFGTDTGNKNGELGIQVTKLAYWSPEAFSVAASTANMQCKDSAGAVVAAKDFIVSAAGANSKDLATGNTVDGARKASEVNTAGSEIMVQMDNTGFTCLGTGCTTSGTPPSTSCNSWVRY